MSCRQAWRCTAALFVLVIFQEFVGNKKNIEYRQTYCSQHGRLETTKNLWSSGKMQENHCRCIYLGFKTFMRQYSSLTLKQVSLWEIKWAGNNQHVTSRQEAFVPTSWKIHFILISIQLIHFILLCVTWMKKSRKKQHKQAHCKYIKNYFPKFPQTRVRHLVERRYLLSAVPVN